jgi:hypothetical protein
MLTEIAAHQTAEQDYKRGMLTTVVLRKSEGTRFEGKRYTEDPSAEKAEAPLTYKCN